MPNLDHARKEAWLRAHGYDGLRGDDCGCEIGDLAPCPDGWCHNGCRPAVKVNLPGHECDGWFVSKREKRRLEQEREYS